MSTLQARYSDPQSKLNNPNLNSGVLTKYALGAGIAVSIAFIWIFGGYIHARQRVKAGKKPLFYHKWFIHSSEQQQFQPGGFLSSYGRAGVQYELQNTGGVWRRPEEDTSDLPPEYSHDMPPAYQPAHKLDSSEDLQRVTGESSMSSEHVTEQAEAPANPPDEEDVTRPARIYTAGAGPPSNLPQSR